MRVGEHVAFSGKFLKSTASYELAKLRGFVIDIDGMIAKVHWTIGGQGPMHVLIKNLVPASEIYKEAV